MFSGKKPAPPKRRNRDLSQFGLANIPDDFETSQGMDDGNDSDLEAELARITGGGKTETKSKSKSTAIPASDLEKMIADSLRDIDSDHDDNDEETVNDPELLSELQSMTGNNVEIESEVPSEAQLFLPTSSNDIIDIIKRRIELYKQAETQAKANGDAAKSRRFNRGLKTLTNQLKQVSLGNSINIDDIPPEINGKSTSPASTDEKNVETPSVPTRTAPLPPAPSTPSLPEQQTSPIDQTNPTTNAITSSDKNSIISQLNARRLEYKTAALNAKRSGDVATALQFLKVVKQFDIVIKMCENEQEVDLSDMPPPPTEFMEFLAKMKENADGGAQEETSKTPNEVNIESETQADEAEKEPKSVLQALEQRLAKYKSVEKTAKDENNSSKVRRFGRIIKQYEDAIKLYKAGKAVDFEELPVPPGCGPLPIPSNEPSSTPAETERTPTSPTSSSSADDASSQTTASATSPQPHESLQKQELTTRISGNQHSTNLAEQQMKILIERQKEFRIAAVEAKKAGELEQAKEYLKIYKGFEALLNAASNGLPVDLTSLPVPPSQRESLEVSFAIVNGDDCDPNDDISDISIRIEEQLAKQLMMCKNTRDHHKAMGDVAGMNRFENLALAVQKDLDLVRYSKKKKFPLPKFHYEKKSFNIVHCNTDLTDNEVEIVVLRGINYNVPNPKDVDTYVKVEFPYPQDDFFKTKTAVVRNTDSPDYDQRYKVEIQRSNRQCQRIFKRQAVKFEVYSKGGFLRSDTLIGTVTVKLQPLETKCEIHDTFDLMDGRKTVGGKLEVKVRVRNPIYTKQIEHIDEKWLILDS